MRGGAGMNEARARDGGLATAGMDNTRGNIVACVVVSLYCIVYYDRM